MTKNPLIIKKSFFMHYSTLFDIAFMIFRDSGSEMRSKSRNTIGGIVWKLKNRIAESEKLRSY